MTLQQVFSQMTMDPLPIMLYFIGIPVLALLLNWIANDESHTSPWNYVYSALIFLVCIPGTFSIILCGYSMFFQPQSLLQVNALVYFLPIVSMVATTMIVKQEADVNRLPGFNKLSGLVMLLAITFIAMLLIQKTRIWVMFVGNMGSLLILFLVLFVLFRIAWSRLMYSSDKAGIK